MVIKQNPYAILLLPMGLFLCLIFLGPFLYMIVLSFTDFSFVSSQSSGQWIGLQNYIRAFNDTYLLNSVMRSSIFTILCVTPQITIGLLLVEILFNNQRTRQILTPILALPILIPSIIVGLYWKLMLQGEFGILSYYLSKIGMPGANALLSTPSSVLFTLAIIDSWQWAPIVLLMLLAARDSLPREPLEAAWIDGTSRTRAFFHITLPALIPYVFIISVIRAIDSFKEFDKVYLLTGGGPGTASELLSINIWRTAFRSWEFGYAAALCIIVYFGILIITNFAMKKMKRLEIW